MQYSDTQSQVYMLWFLIFKMKNPKIVSSAHVAMTLRYSWWLVSCWSEGFFALFVCLFVTNLVVTLIAGAAANCL